MTKYNDNGLRRLDRPCPMCGATEVHEDTHECVNCGVFR